MLALRRWQSLSNAAILAVLAHGAVCPDSAQASQSEIFLDPAAGAPAAPHETYPRIDGRLIGYIENTYFFDVKGPEDAGLPTAWQTLDPFLQGAAVVRLSPRLSLSGLAEFRSFEQAPADRAFDKLDGRLRNLFVTYGTEQATYFAGKFEVGYGEAWETMDGIYSGFSGDYSYPGSLGLGGRWSWQKTDSPRHTVTSILFKRDNTGLNRTWSRSDTAPLQLEDGGPGNTRDPRSGGLAYELSDIPALPGLRGGVTVARLARGSGENDLRAETGVGVHANYETRFSDTWGMRLFAEAVHLRGFMGRQASATDLVASASLSQGPMLYTIAAARRSVRALQGNLIDQGFTASQDWGWASTVAYQTDSGFIIQAGFLRQQEQGISFNQGLLRLIYVMGS